MKLNLNHDLWRLRCWAVQPLGLLVLLVPAVAQGTGLRGLTPAAAQATALRGMASAWPAVVVVEGPSDNGGEQLRLKGVGDQVPSGNATLVSLSSPLAVPLVAQSGEYVALNAHLGLGAGDLDAISSGNAIIGVPSAGVAGTPQGWMNITVSIANQANGPLDGYFEDAAVAGRQVGSELVSYAVKRSVRFPDTFVGQAVLETNRMQFGFEAGSTDDIKALDYGMGVQSVNLPGRETALFGQRHQFYFSVTRAFANGPSTLADSFAYPASGGPPIAANATDIYFTECVNGVWQPVIQWLPGDLLGLNRDLDELDALEVHVDEETVIYSASTDSEWGYAGIPVKQSQMPGDTSQLMIAAFDRSVTPIVTTESPTPLMDQATGGSTTTVASEIGVIDLGDASEVDAVCVVDPEGHLHDEVCGTLFRDATRRDDRMGISLVRSVISVTDSRHTLQATGWGGATPQAATVFVFRRRLDHNGVAGSSWNLVLRTLRTAADNEVTYDIRTPANGGAPFGYRVLMLDAAGDFIGQSFDIAIFE